MDEALTRELLAMRAEDLRVRAALERDDRLSGGYAPEMERVHRANAARLHALIARHGWPTLAIAGAAGAEAAWLIAQHAIGEPDFQRQCLLLLEQAAARDEVPAWHAAYLIDRIRMYEGWPQIYGTQSRDTENGSELWPIADRSTVNERRRAVGLEALSAVPEPPPHLTPEEREERRARARRGDEWARRAGWRTRILHLARQADWTTARRTGVYRPESLASEGFIHCSEPQQVIGVANARFRGRDDLVLLQIAVGRLPAPPRYENLEGGDELFPHIYAPLHLDPVIRATAFPARPDGSFDHDQLAAVY